LNTKTWPRKNACHFLKATGSDEPGLYLTSRRHTEREAAVTPIKLYSNAAEATLLVNGERSGTRPVNHLKIAVWDAVGLKPGENRIEVEANLGGNTVMDMCLWTLNRTAKVGLR